ncbi:MAG: hypothetical protein HYZ24_15485 [Chloroflexi bacterium]|nr:hypothetical protein [Chloroflexota bacterium]
MLKETVQLEKLRQKIEDLRAKSGDRADFIDYGKPNPAQLKEAQETIKKLDLEIKTGQAELKQLLDNLRKQQPQIIEEWVKYHVSLLERIIAENSTDRNAGTRKYVAKETIANWEKVRLGEVDYVNINGSFLKDYKMHIRSINENTQIGELIKEMKNSNSSKPENKAWWQFWK